MSGLLQRVVEPIAEEWVAIVASLWAAAASAWVEVSFLEREIVSVVATRLSARGIDELEATYCGGSSFKWPSGLFRSVCNEGEGTVDVDGDSDVLAVVGFAWQLGETIGHHVRIPHVENLSNFVGRQVDQVEVNCRVEEDRVSVLEGLVGVSARPVTKPFRVPPCVSRMAASLHMKREEALSMRRDTASFCGPDVGHVDSQKEVGVHPDYTDNWLGKGSLSADSRISGLHSYIKTQLQWSEHIHGHYFNAVQKLWERTSLASAKLQSLEARTLAVELALQPHGLRVGSQDVWAREAEDACDDDSVFWAGGFVSLIQRHLMLARESVEELGAEGDFVDKGKRRQGACGVLLNLVGWAEVVDVDAHGMADWHALLVRRVDAISRVWRSLSDRNEWLHTWMRRHLSDYRRRAFEEIYMNMRWGGPRSSGGGSSDRSRTTALAEEVVSLVRERGVRVLLDLGCGWGEWLPPALCEATRSGRLPAGLRYIGWDIAENPVRGLRDEADSGSLHGCGVSWEFWRLDGTEHSIPDGVDLVVARHVLQHLGVQDALAVLRNIRRGTPKAVLLSQVSGARNVDLDQLYGGISSFGIISKDSSGSRLFDGYDLRQPPFALPDPEQVLSDGPRTEAMLLYRAADLFV
eukprot:TRINITY_DN55051_c0_g1_i1.p1 TRINITY_DN55051_c0_g1~~TRINITY_DN55051_c0_g1_i1.p1  ORF type:complete len:651 (-),score=91.07 TRINITY_DN55051_c0_g1_i1:71-1975(-)